jgi:hypothetical protein
MPAPSRIRTDLYSTLSSKFEIIDYFDFLDNDSDPSSFYVWCQQWENFKFSHNQRLLIIDHDTDYYQENQIVPYGNNSYNFFKCCGYFNLPTEFMIIFSGTHGKHIEISSLCKLFNLTPPTVGEYLHLSGYSPIHRPVSDIEFNINKINKLFFCLNGTRRSYRVLFLCYLIENNLIDCGYISYHFKHSIKDNLGDNPNKTITNTLLPIHLQTTIPFSRINDWYLKDKTDLKMYDLHATKFLNNTQPTSYYSELVDDGDIWDLGSKFLQHALINVICETAYHYPWPHLSEKTIKPILTKRPFIMVGAAKNLSLIRSFGFKTFNSVWDESYDEILDPGKRMQAIVNLLSELSTRNLFTLSEQIQDIVEYNFNHYCKNYIANTMIKWY